MSQCFRIFLVLAFFCLCISTASARRRRGSGSRRAHRRRRCGRRDYYQLKSKIRRLVRESNEAARWPARFLRIGFHDCLAKSCDGSIVFELDREENVGVNIIVDFLQNARRRSCVSLADTIKIGLELSMELSGGPLLKCPLGTKDVRRPNPPKQIGLATDDFRTLIKTFRSKGFSVREAIAANYGGHSLGGFNTPDGSFPFTRTPDKFNNKFCKFIKRGTADQGMTGFNALPSDRVLAERSNTQKLVAEFARDGRKLQRVFGRFMRKLCRM